MAIVQVGRGSQVATVTGSNVDSATVAFPANILSGSLLIVAGATWKTGAGADAVAVTDTRSTSYTVILGAGNTNAGGQTKQFIARGVSATAGACTVTIDPTSTGNYFNVAIDEYTGQHATPLDVDGGESTGTGTTASDSITTSVDDALVIAVLGGGNTAGAITPTPTARPLAQLHEIEAVTAQNTSILALYAGTAGAKTLEWTIASQPWSVSTASFAPAATSSTGGVGRARIQAGM